MTDHEPEPGMPTAGRKPADVPPGEAGTVRMPVRPPSVPAADATSGSTPPAFPDDDEPTAPMIMPVRPPESPDDEATIRTAPVRPPASHDEPPGRTAPASPDDEATTRIGTPLNSAPPAQSAPEAVRPPMADDEPTVNWSSVPQVGPADVSQAGPADAPPAGPAPGVGETTRVIGSQPAGEPTVERPRLEPATVELDGATQPLWGASPRPAPAEAQQTTEPEPAGQGTRRAEPSPDPVTGVASATAAGVPAWRRMSSAGALIALLLALFGFTLVVQLRSNDGAEGLTTARQEDLVRILSDLEARDSRLQSEIGALENSQRQLTSGVAGRRAALDEADKRADELGLLAGTLPGRGPGLRVTLDKVKASAILNAVQELRGSGGEVMQLAGSNGTAVRVVASSYFVDAEGGGILVDGVRLTGPYTLDVIGLPQTMQPALQIPGGVVASVNSGGGSVTLEQRSMVEVTAVRKATTLQYARPVS